MSKVRCTLRYLATMATASDIPPKYNQFNATSYDKKKIISKFKIPFLLFEYGLFTATVAKIFGKRYGIDCNLATFTLMRCITLKLLKLITSISATFPNSYL